jgi:phage-related protein
VADLAHRITFLRKTRPRHVAIRGMVGDVKAAYRNLRVNADYAHLFELLAEYGPNLRLPHARPMGDGLFELRLKGADGIARVFFCTLIGRRIMMLHSFVKKSRKTPLREVEVARKRMKEVKDANA